MAFNRLNALIDFEVEQYRAGTLSIEIVCLRGINQSLSYTYAV
jgi:hypothetical protein